MEESTVANEVPQGASNETAQETSGSGVLGLRTDERTGRKIVETVATATKPTEVPTQAAPQEKNSEPSQQPVESQQSEPQQAEPQQVQQSQQPVRQPVIQC